MTYKTIIWKIEHGIGYITLAKPPKNEMDTLFFKELAHLVYEAGANNKLKGLIIRSEGRHFSSGADVGNLLSLFNTADDRISSSLVENSEAIQALSNFTIPVVACLKGICFGSGLELALSAHFRVAAPKTLLSLPETGFQIMPGLGGVYNTQRLMGTAKSLEFVLSGMTMEASNAQKTGLIDFIENKDRLENFAKHIVMKFGGNYKKELKPMYMEALKEQII